MSVDYYCCAECGEPCNDHEPDVKFCGCDNVYCSDKCAKKAGFIFDDDTGNASCGYCRGEKFTDAELLQVALDELKINRDELVHIAKSRIIL